MAQVALRFNLSGLINRIIPQRPVIVINRCPDTDSVLSITYTKNQKIYEITPDKRVVEITGENNLQRAMYRRFENKIRESLARDFIRRQIPFPKEFEFLQNDYEYKIRRNKLKLVI